MRDDGLEEYRSKRDFEATPEPEGSGEGTGAGLFVIQKHASRALHYDFRLEFMGVLKSWAVPKGPSTGPGDKRLAVRVEDHPLEYAGFEGIIPKGEYGGGTVVIWDRGFWVPVTEPAEGLAKGHLKFMLCGKKLRGAWALVKLKGTPQGEGAKDEWLLVKEADDEASTKRDLLRDEPASVVSGKTLEEIAELPDGIWRTKGGAAPLLPQIPRAEKREMPSEITPQLAREVDGPPAGEQWVHELKYDGYRCLARIVHGEVSLLTRNGNDWTYRFPSIKKALSRLPVERAWLDGEVVALKDNGTTSFESLQNSLAVNSDKGLIYMVFDILYYNGYETRGLPLSERKLLASNILKAAKDLGVLRYSQHVEGKGQAFFENACAYGIEGIISKRKDSPYTGGRAADWVKVKCHERQEFVIGGYTEPNRGRRGFGALLIGVFDGAGRFTYCGRVGTGFNERSLMELWERLKKIERKAPAFHNAPEGAMAKGVHWVVPELVAEVEFAEWTRDGVLRHPSFQGLREDKAAREVVHESPARLREAVGPSNEEFAPPVEAQREVGGKVRLTNPERVFYPEDGFTKKELAGYYEMVAPLMLPHIVGRPLTLVRCPEGYDKECFFQKHFNGTVPPDIKRVKLVENDGTPAEYLMVDSPEGLVGLTQLGVLEIHAWGSRSNKLEFPDRMVFDIDPDQGVEWEKTVEAVYLLRALLDELGLKSFVKSTGGKGLHVVVPVLPVRDWAEVKAFTRALAEFVARGLPDRFTSMMTKRRRTGKIFIDYMRNIRGATAIEAYSTRASRGAPVAVPLGWDELMEIRPDMFTLANVKERIKQAGNPWKGYMDLKQPVTDEMMARLGMVPGKTNDNRGENEKG